MKTKLFLLLFGVVALVCSTFASVPPSSGTVCDIQIVVTPQKIWFMTDESPVKRLDVQVTNESGNVVVEKTLSSKMTDWSVSVQDLPAGKYQIWLNAKLSKTFLRKRTGA